MPGRVESPKEILLNSVPYRIKGRVQNSLASLFPRKTVSGDVKGDDQQRASTLRMADWRGGIGNYNKGNAYQDAPDAWWSTCQTRHHGHLALPQLATLTAASGALGSFTVGVIGELASEVYGVFGTDVRKFDNTTDSWGSSLHTLPAVATDVITVRLGGTVYLVIAHTGGYTYTSDGAAFTDDTKDAKYLSFWNEWLWGIDDTGQLWWSSTIGDEQNDAQLQLPDGNINRLFPGRNAAGKLILFAGTRRGLFAHDFEATKWVETEFALPEHPDNGLGSTRWRDAIYVPSGLGTYRYIQGDNQAIVQVMGLDRHDGVPSDKRGVIRQLIGTHTDLLAITDATTAPGTLDMYDGLGGGSVFGPAVIEPDVGYSYIAGWDQRGWEIKWLGGSGDQQISAALVSNAYGEYRLWWAQNQRVYYMPLRRDIVNPTQVTTLTYASSGEHITSWFDADEAGLAKLALELRVEVQDASADETVAVDYATNYDDDNWTSLGTISSNGITTYKFPDSTTPNGTAFRAIRFRLRLARGSTTTLSPDVVSVTFVFRKKLPARWGYSFMIDLEDEYKGVSAAKLRSNLITAIENDELVEFTFRDDSTNDRNFYVDVIMATGLEETGRDERGESMVFVAEP